MVGIVAVLFAYIEKIGLQFDGFGFAAVSESNGPVIMYLNRRRKLFGIAGGKAEKANEAECNYVFPTVSHFLEVRSHCNHNSRVGLG